MEMPAAVDVPANVDTGAILKQIQIVKNEFNTYKIEFPKKHEVDLNGLRNELKGYTDHEVSHLKKETNDKIRETQD